jgi:hypothetical protein
MDKRRRGGWLHSRTRAAFATALLLTVFGCFSYVPVDYASVPAGHEVRVRVTQNGASELREIVDDYEPRGSPTVSGTLVSRSTEALLVRVPVAVRSEGFFSAELGQDLRIPISDVLDVESRQLDRARTGLLVAGGVVATLTLIFQIMDSWGERGNPGGLPNDESRVPVGRLYCC